MDINTENNFLAGRRNRAILFGNEDLYLIQMWAQKKAINNYCL